MSQLKFLGRGNRGIERTFIAMVVTGSLAVALAQAVAALVGIWLPRSLLPATQYRRRGWAAVLGASWVFATLLPGVVPMPGFFPFVWMMLLPSLGTVLLITLNVWVIGRAPRSPSVVRD